MQIQSPAIAGDVTLAGYPGWISVSSFSVDLSSSVTANSAGGSISGKVACPRVLVTKPLDSASPRLAFALFKEESLGTVTLAALKDLGSGTFKYLTFTLTNATVSQVSLAGSGAVSAQAENVTFNPEKLVITYIPQKPDGTGGAPVSAGYDCATNTTF
jgi:type VI secretion system secreted protein Hcp